MNLDALPLSPMQIRAIVESQQHRVSILSGAVRSGKTVASLISFLIALAEAPPSGLVTAIGRTLQTIERNLFDPLQDPALFGSLAAEVHHTRGSSVATILGRTVHLIGANDARAEGKLRGMTACLALVDEATLIPQVFWTQLLARLSVPSAKLISTTNPDNPSHWLRRDFILRADELNLGHWHFTLDDNPSLAPAYVEALKREFVGLFYRRYVEGAWIAAEGAIYDMFDERHHVVSQLPLIRKWLALGVDYGTTNPFAALLVGVGVDNRLYVAGEYRYDSRIGRRSKTDAEYSVEMRAWLDAFEVPRDAAPSQQAVPIRGVRPEWVAVDPSAASFIQQCYRDGLSPTAARNSVMDGIRSVAMLLSNDRLRVHKSCRGLIDEFPGYSWNDAKALVGIDEPVKVDDHSIDALRYAVYTTEAAWRPLLRKPIPTMQGIAA